MGPYFGTDVNVEKYPTDPKCYVSPSLKTDKNSPRLLTSSLTVSQLIRASVSRRKTQGPRS